MKTEHNHVFVKDPARFGYRCAVDGCDRFKTVAEFDAVIPLRRAQR
jgi:hypothetical protein